jgi:NADPH:quinone reductase-like Zn-dependent oxidoreductase
MHAAVIAEPGGPGVLRWTELADPVPGPDEVLVASGHSGKIDLRAD